MYYLKLLIVFLSCNLKIILGFFLFMLSYFILSYTVSNTFNESYIRFKTFAVFDKVKSMLIIICCLVLILIFLCRRVINLDGSLDLVDVYLNLESFFKKNSNIENFAAIFLGSSMFFLCLVLFKYLKKIFYTHMFKIHLYLLSKETVLHCNDSYSLILRPSVKSYYYLAEQYSKLFFELEEIPYKIIKPFLPLLIGEDSKKDLKYLLINHKLSKQIPNFFLYLLILSFIFDMIFNHLYITKIFYLLPWAFVYYVLHTYYLFLNGDSDKKFMSLIACTKLSFFYYSDLINVKKYLRKDIYHEEDEIIMYYFSNGYYCDKKHMDEILQLIHKMSR